jgi:hypothetical protein
VYNNHGKIFKPSNGNPPSLAHLEALVFTSIRVLFDFSFVLATSCPDEFHPSKPRNNNIKLPTIQIHVHMMLEK